MVHFIAGHTTICGSSHPLRSAGTLFTAFGKAELPRHAALCSPCGIFSTSCSSKPAAQALPSPLLRKHQSWAPSLTSQGLQFSYTSLCLSFSFCYHPPLPLVPSPFLAASLKCSGTGVVPREKGTKPALLRPVASREV